MAGAVARPAFGGPRLPLTRLSGIDVVSLRLSMSASSSPASEVEPPPADEHEAEGREGRASLHSVPPPHAAAQVIGKRPRMSRFRRFLVAVTTLCHLPFVVALAELSGRLGAPALAAWAFAILVAAVGVYLFLGRAENIANDAPRPWTKTFLFDVPFLVEAD